MIDNNGPDSQRRRKDMPKHETFEMQESETGDLDMEDEVHIRQDTCLGDSSRV